MRIPALRQQDSIIREVQAVARGPIARHHPIRRRSPDNGRGWTIEPHSVIQQTVRQTLAQIGRHVQIKADAQVQRQVLVDLVIVLGKEAPFV